MDLRCKIYGVSVEGGDVLSNAAKKDNNYSAKILHCTVTELR